MKDLIFSILRPFLEAYAMLRYKSIWGLKARLQKRPGKLMKLTYGNYFLRRGSFVGLDSEFVGTPCFPHGVQGIFISNGAKLGRDVVIFQQVTIGSNTLPGSKCPGAPTIGDNVYRRGRQDRRGITVGDNCRIGANAVVYEDMPANSVAVCARPASCARRRSTTPTPRRSTGWTTTSGTESCTSTADE
ncbi:MAG: hypothetical protein ACLVL7_06230 [Anaerotruncus massiliensis (ex Togo et al. 2019)]